MLRINYHQICRHICALILAVLLHFNTSSQRPNIIYIMSDDMGYADLSGYGRKEYQTPHLDKLASQGIKFINAYSAGAVCTPTRAGFMTGRYPARIPVGLREPLAKTKADSLVGLTKDYPSVASLMKKAGYETALIGKWHLGYQPENNPTKNGYDYFFGFLAGGADYISHKSGPKGNRGDDFFENDQPIHIEGYLTDLFTQRAIGFINKTHNKPFFLAVMFNAPHWPWQGPSDKPYEDSVEFTSKGSPSTYAVMMKSLDDAVGNILKALDEKQLTNQTIIIFTNDNGGERFSDNGGLTKAKGTLWEGGIRVPAFVRWPGKIVPGSSTSQPAITMDWTATILSAAGARPNAQFPLDGIDLTPVLTGKGKNIDRTFYWRTFQRLKQKAIREGDWKYLQDQQGEYLFNLAVDQSEKNNLKEQEPVIFERLKKKYADWEKTVLTPVSL